MALRDRSTHPAWNIRRRALLDATAGKGKFRYWLGIASDLYEFMSDDEQAALSLAQLERDHDSIGRINTIAKNRMIQFTSKYGRAPSFIAEILHREGGLTLTQRKEAENAFGIAIRVADGLPEKAAQNELLTAPWQPGRQNISGRISSLKEIELEHGVTIKLVVVNENGLRVWVTCPRWLDPHVGNFVTMRVTVVPSGKDPYFAFGERPTKAKVGK